MTVGCLILNSTFNTIRSYRTFKVTNYFEKKYILMKRKVLSMVAEKLVKGLNIKISIKMEVGCGDKNWLRNYKSTLLIIN